MLKMIASLALILCLGAAPALAQTDADTDASIDNSLGDHAPYRVAYDAIQKAVTDGDKAAVAGWVNYPIAVTIDGNETVIADAAQFEEHYDGIVTEEIKGAITGQKWSDLFANYQGVMFGDGQVWLNGICTDEKCTSFDVKVITIQSTADITPKAN